MHSPADLAANVADQAPQHIPVLGRLAANRVIVRPSVSADVYALAANLREMDRLEVAGLGLEPRSAIRQSYRHAILRRTAFVDGEIAAMWGVGGSMLSDEGAPWLMTTPAAARVPLSFVRVGRAHLAEMLACRRRLANVVLARYEQACRFLEIIGFTLGDPEPCGPRGELYRRFSIERA